MSRYIIKRLLMAIPVLIGITIIDYALMCAAGSPLEMMVGARFSQSALELKAAQLGLNQPIYVQYFYWLMELLQGNLGTSIKTYQSVSTMIGSHIGPTLLLMGTSLILSLVIALPVGIYSAVNQYSKKDFTIVTTSFVASSIPSFFLSLIFIYLFALVLKWLPSSGMATLGADFNFLDLLAHMALPVSVLTLSLAGSNIRYIRTSMLEILQKDYLKAALAKGIGKRKVLWKHAFKNALLPIISVIGMQIPMLFGGAVVVEQVFSWPGLGLLMTSAITSRDYPVIMGVCLLSAVVVLVANLLTDIAYALVDPTVKLK